MQSVEGNGISRARKITSRLAILVTSVLLTMMAAEGVVRRFGEQNSQGEFTFMGRRLRPYALPVEVTTTTVHAHLASPAVYLMYDSYLGWTIRPNAEGSGGLFASNAKGIRSPLDYAQAPRPGVLRIALFGDSFTHADDVPYEDTWGHQLEVTLRQRGIEAEVMNFGVQGYGMDQAFLRWASEGQIYAPDIVLFGFQAENVLRNLNLFRAIYLPGTNVPFTKPRFVLSGGNLQVVNIPTVPLEEIPSLVANFEEFPLVEYEYFFDPADYADSLWWESRLLALTLEVVEPGTDSSRPSFYSLDGEGARLALAITQKFAEGAQAQGSDFFVVHLPARSDLERIASGRELVYSDLLGAFDGEFQVVHTEVGFEGPDVDRCFAPGGHYSAEGNRIVAEAIAPLVVTRGASVAE